MVSAFMSFATGALQEVGKQIDKYQAQEYQQEQLEAAADREDDKMRLANNLEGDLRRDLLKREQKFAAGEFDRKIAAEETLRGSKLSDQEKLERLRFGFREKEIKMEQTFKEGESGKERKQRATLSANELEARKKIAGMKTKLDKAKNFKTVGNLEWNRNDSKPDEEVKNLMRSIEANPDAFTSALNDAETSTKMMATLKSAFGQITKGVGSFSIRREILPGGAKTEYVPRPHLVSQLTMLGVTNKKVLSFARQFMSPAKNMGVNVGTDAAAVTNNAGRISVFKEIPGLDKAVDRFRRTQYGTEFLSRSDIVSKISNRLGEMSDSETKKYIAAYNSPLGSVISEESFPTTEQYNRAQEYLYDPKNGFVDEEGGLKVRDFRKIVEVFGRGNDTGKAIKGAIPEPIKFRAINNKDVAKDVTSTREKGESAIAADRSIDMLMQLLTVSGSSGRIIDNVRVLKLGLPQLIKDGTAIVAELLQSRQGMRNNTFVDSNGNTVAKYDDDALGMFQTVKDQARVAMATGSAADKASAQINMYEMVLAYQITGILQGGTGGRTISDDDIKRALGMFTQSVGSLPTRLEKLKSLKGLVKVAINKKTMYDILTDNKNAGIYSSAKKAFSLIKNEYTLDNFHVLIDGRAKTGEAAITANSISGVVATINEKRLMGGSFNRGAALEGIGSLVTGGGTPQISANEEYVFNKEAHLKWRQAVQDSITTTGKLATVNKRQLNNIKKRLEREHPTVFDLKSGKLKKIQFNTNGSISFIEDEEEQKSSINLTATPTDFVSLSNKLFAA